MSPPRATWGFERKLRSRGFELIAGVDEVGLGCLAGPVVAGAVILKPDTRIDFIRDSKTLSPRQRERLAAEISQKALAWAISEVSPEEIAVLNLHRAAIEAMRRALLKLSITPQAVLVDAFKIPHLPYYQEAIIKGDRRVRSIAAASIVAKVHRDTLMKKLDTRYPAYGFAIHKGYATSKHRDLLEKLGPCPIHRRSFRLVRER